MTDVKAFFRLGCQRSDIILQISSAFLCYLEWLAKFKNKMTGAGVGSRIGSIRRKHVDRAVACAGRNKGEALVPRLGKGVRCVRPDMQGVEANSWARGKS
jgi:hypothetical protein